MTQEEFNQMFLVAMEAYGAALDDTAANGEAPLTTDTTEVDASSVLLNYMPNGVPTKYLQTTMAILAQVVATHLEGGVEVLYATYNTTTFSTVEAAYSAGKAISCIVEDGNIVLPLIGATGTQFTFGAIRTSGIVTIATLTSTGNTWATTSFNIQTALTFDNSPTANSNNPVKSGGVYTALEGKLDEVTQEQFNAIFD